MQRNEGRPRLGVQRYGIISSLIDLEAPLTDTALQLLEDIITERKRLLDPSGAMEADEFFEFFSTLLVLREYKPTPGEIRSGLVSQTANSTSPGTDGGIDAMYLYVNGNLISDIEQARDLRALKQNISFDVLIIQSSRESGFGMDRLLRLKDTSDNIFLIDKDPDNFSEHYNAELTDCILRFREIHRALLTKNPTINVKFYYATKGDRSKIAPDSDLALKALALESDVKAKLPTITQCTVSFIGARRLIDIDRLPPQYTDTLRCSSSINLGKAYIALVDLSEYNRFITGGSASILEHLFDSNVREYEGDVEVNQNIMTTLKEKEREENGSTLPPLPDFWWLNNGITILADQITGRPTELCLKEPRIVNGLQTSTQIYRYFQAHPQSEAKRHVSVKLIESEETEMQDRIIKATNSQTRIPAQYLFATEQLQRDIEQVFRASKLHYGRRKNSWIKGGAKIDDVVGMTELAQSVAAIYLQQPDQARGRPSRYFKKDYYKTVFSIKYPIDLYVSCALVKKRAEQCLRNIEPNRADRANLLFYVAMAAVSIHLKTPRANKSSLVTLDVPAIPEAHFAAALSMVRPIYDRISLAVGQQRTFAGDVAAKGTDMVKDLKTELVSRFRRKKRGR